MQFVWSAYDGGWCYGSYTYEGFIGFVHGEYVECAYGYAAHQIYYPFSV